MGSTKLFTTHDENFMPRMQLSKLLFTTEILIKNSNRNEISNEQFNLCEAKISLDESIKFISSQTNNESRDNYGFTAESYKLF